MRKIGLVIREITIPFLVFILFIVMNLITFWFYDDSRQYEMGSQLYIIFMECVCVGILLLLYRYGFKMMVKEFFDIKAVSRKNVVCLLLFVPGYYVLMQKITFLLCKDTLVYDNNAEILTYGQLIIYSLMAITVAPVFEEVTMRLGMIGYAKTKLGKVYGLFLSSAIFSAIHEGNRARHMVIFLDAFLLGSILLVSGSIIYTILFHLFINWTIFVLAIADKFISNLRGMPEGYLADGKWGVILVNDSLFWTLIAISIFSVFLWGYWRKKLQTMKGGLQL